MSGAAPDIRHVCDFDFMRCRKCGRLMTKPEMERAICIGAGGTVAGTGLACPCGSLGYLPTNPRGLEWLLPRVVTFAWARVQEIGWRAALSRESKGCD